MNTIMETFGEVLKRIRIARGFTLKQLAMKYGRLQGKEDGIYTSAISGLESGYRNPSRTVIALLCEAMQCSDGERNEMLTAAGMLPEFRHDLNIGGLMVSVYSLSSNITKEEIDEVTRTIQAQLEK